MINVAMNKCMDTYADVSKVDIMDHKFDKSFFINQINEIRKVIMKPTRWVLWSWCCSLSCGLSSTYWKWKKQYSLMTYRWSSYMRVRSSRYCSCTTECDIAWRHHRWNCTVDSSIRYSKKWGNRDPYEVLSHRQLTIMYLLFKIMESVMVIRVEKKVELC